MKKHICRLFTLCTLAFVLQGCTSRSEEKAYEEVLSTLSLEKLGDFLENYPESRLGNVLTGEFSRLCKADPEPEACYRMLLKAIPPTHYTYLEISNRLKAGN